MSHRTSTTGLEFQNNNDKNVFKHEKNGRKCPIADITTTKLHPGLCLHQ